MLEEQGKRERDGGNEGLARRRISDRRMEKSEAIEETVREREREKRERGEKWWTLTVRCLGTCCLRGTFHAMDAMLISLQFLHLFPNTSESSQFSSLFSPQPFMTHVV